MALPVVHLLRYLTTTRSADVSWCVCVCMILMLITVLDLYALDVTTRTPLRRRPVGGTPSSDGG
jgi:hypothetical protein